MRVIDFHVHSGNRESRIPFTVGDIRDSMAVNRVDYSVVFSSHSTKKEMLVVDTIRNCKSSVVFDGLIPFLRFDPNLLAPWALVEIVCDNPQIRGFKFHPREEDFDPLDKKYKGLFDVISKTGFPVVMHSRKENSIKTDPDRIVDICGIYTDINFVFGHFANDSNVFFKKLDKYPNGFVETSIVSSPKIIQFRVEDYGADKILFGSDTPYSDQHIELMKIIKCDISSDDKDKILFKNAARLLEM